jgi:predicted dehydrogenase
MIELSRNLGRLLRVEAHFNVRFNPENNIRFQLALGGGSLMDIGSYNVHMLRTVVGSEPDVLRASAVEGPKGIDTSMEAELSFPGGVLGITTSNMLAEKTAWPESMTFHAYGDGGQLKVLNPMCPQWGHRILATLADGTKVEEELDGATSYEYQLRAFCEAVSGSDATPTGGADSVANMRLIDAIYEASGLGVRP